jgi:hypothetical protein
MRATRAVLGTVVLGALLWGGVTASADAAPAAATTQAPGTTVGSVSAGPVTVAAGTTLSTVTARVSTASLPTTTVVWELQRTSGACRLYASGRMAPAGNGTFTARWQASPTSLATDDCSGTARLTVTAVDVSKHGGVATRTADVPLLRSTSVAVDRLPGAVRRGGLVPVSGQATVADWDRRRSDGLARRQVQLRFQPTGGQVRAVRTLTTSADGRFAVRLPQTQAGCWTVTVPSSFATAVATSAGACVRLLP